MSTYLMFAQNAFRQNVIYRANTIIYAITSMLYLLIQFSIWQALYATQATIEQVSLPQMLTYCVINQLVRAFTDDEISSNLGAKIRSGEIGGDFVRPINLKLYLIADQLGNSVYEFCFNFIPIVIITVLCGAFTLPASIFHGVAFVVSLALGILLGYLINYALGLIAFWVKNNGFVNWLMRALTNLFAGTVIPFGFYPSVLQKIALVLPFRYMTFDPISIYLGKTANTEILSTIGMQLFWIAVIYMIGRIVWSRAEKRVFVQGG